MKALATLIVLGGAGYAIWADNLLAAAMAIIGYALGILAMLTGQVSAPVRPENLPPLQQESATLSDTDYDRIAEIARNGSKLEAIKEFRAATNSSLRDAKEAVEMMVQQNAVHRHD